MSLDSSNIEPEDWRLVARAVCESFDEFDGTIILHGTDTMAYTASALAFMLRNPGRPVILTGSQIPDADPCSDSRSNLAVAVAAVANGINGVTVSFCNKIINGTRAAKSSSSDMDAFESVGAPPVAVMTAFGLEVNEARRHEPFTESPSPDDCNVCPDVALLKIIPGTKPDIFEALKNIGCRGVVIEAFGAGGVHCARRNLAQAASRAVSGGMPIILRSQCPDGKVDLNAYEVGARLRDAGVIPVRMTAEACVAKLMWALYRSPNVSEVEKIFRTNIAGELVV
jgi:L-asparaginase